MSLSALIEKIADDTAYVRDRVDHLDARMSAYEKDIEHRMTKLEGRSSLIAMLISAMVSALAAVAFHHRGAP